MLEVQRSQEDEFGVASLKHLTRKEKVNREIIKTNQ
jgi:hypothetical protein